MIKVLIVDDSPLIRAVLKEVLEQADDITVVASAEDPYQARDLIKQHNPDVLTLDIEMPKMDGVSFLKNLMRLRPMPVVMISTLTQKGAPVTLESLEIGAVDYVPKPTSNVDSGLQEYASMLHEKIRTAAKARVRTFQNVPRASDAPSTEGKSNLTFASRQLVAIGASTGGTEAIKEVITRLPSNFPPVVITQHIPPVFSTSFAERMDRCSAMRVKEAEHGEKIESGVVYIAPGDFHFSVEVRGSSLVCCLAQSEPVNRHRPAVDVLFNSVANLKFKVTAALLTGMGADGAKGLLNLKNAGAYTIAQDEQSSVVWGMPKAAIDCDAHCTILPLDKVAGELIKSVQKL